MMIFLAAGLIWSQKMSILARGLMFSSLLPTDPPILFSTGPLKEEEFIQQSKYVVISQLWFYNQPLLYINTHNNSDYRM